MIKRNNNIFKRFPCTPKSSIKMIFNRYTKKLYKSILKELKVVIMSNKHFRIMLMEVKINFLCLKNQIIFLFWNSIQLEHRMKINIIKKFTKIMIALIIQVNKIKSLKIWKILKIKRKEIFIISRNLIIRN